MCEVNYRGPYNRGYLAALRFFHGSRETRQPRSKKNQNNKMNCKLNFGLRSSYIPAVKNALGSRDIIRAYFAAAARCRSRYNLGCRNAAIHTRLYGPEL